MSAAAIAIAVLLVVNSLAFWMFYWDKWCAENDHWRISEAGLLLVALIGGSAGAITALGGAYRSGCVERFIAAGDVRHFLSCLGRA